MKAKIIISFDGSAKVELIDFKNKKETIFRFTDVNSAINWLKEMGFTGSAQLVM